jgi:DNA-binding transcriptional LysR family regulator
MDGLQQRDVAISLAVERLQKARARAEAAETQDFRSLAEIAWPGLQLRALLTLVAVAEEGSFIGAATRLGYSRSTISHQIAQLESVVGTALVERGSGFRTVSLTSAGRVVLAHGRAVLRLLENARAQLATVTDENPRAPRRAAAAVVHL